MPTPPSEQKKSRGKGASGRNASSHPGTGAYHHGDLRNALISEGRALLEEKGALAMSLREVARRIGVSEAAPSRHFNGKEDLLAAIAQNGFDELAQVRVTILLKNLEPVEKARKMMEAYIEFAQRHIGLFYLMVGPMIVERTAYPELLRSSDASFALFADAVIEFAAQNGWTKAQREHVVHCAWSLEHGLAMLILGRRAPRANCDLPVSEMVDFSLAMLLAAIGSGPKHVKQYYAPKKS